MKIIAVLLAIFLAQPAWAYVDPGTGALMIQGLLALIAAVSVALKRYWRQLRAWFRRGDSKQPEESKVP